LHVAEYEEELRGMKSAIQIQCRRVTP
jgi:hypothetical protein